MLAAGTLFLAIAPAVLFLLIWIAVTAARLLFPERPLPFDAAARREAARRRGEAVPVRARDIVDDLRHGAAQPALPLAHRVPEADPLPELAADLWRRRN